MKNHVVVLSIVLFLLGITEYTMAQVSGTVFRDFNGNGVKEVGEPLVAGIEVKAYDVSGAQCGTTQTTTSASAPNYTLSGCSGQVRIEFEIPATGCLVSNTIDYSALQGTTYGSSVQFVNSTSSNVNFAIHYPGEYTSTTNPYVYTPIQMNGDPSQPSVGSASAMFGWPYNNVQTSPSPDKQALGSAIGSTYGVAFSRQAKKLFTSAFLKRHAGMGPLGSGGIYLVDPSTSTMNVSNFVDLDNPSNPLLANPSSITAITTNNTTGSPAYGPGSSFNISGLTITYPPGGLGVIGANGSSGRNLSTTLTGASNDPAAFDQVGKVSLGDLDISDDGRYLFVTNLYNQKIYRLELNNASNPTHVISSISYTLPPISCTNGVLRPFALTFHRGKLYIGALCTGENSGIPANMTGYIFEVPDATSSSTINNTPILQFPLNFDRGNSFTENESFKVWTNTMPSGAPRTWNSQPMFTDIEIDVDGSFIIGIRDRNGDQIGHFNRELTGTTLRDARAVGEILRAYQVPSTCTFELENNGKEGISSSKAATAGAGNGGGPGGGEFYFQDNVYNAATALDALNHANTAQGALAILPGSGNVMTTAMDPVQLWSNGVSLFNNTTGRNIADYELVLSNSSANDGTQSKGNGLGDIEFAAVESPIEIGNRVWNDTDRDGVQDPGEATLSGVTVQLVKSGSVIATAVTNSTGNYYFSNASGMSTTSAIYNITQLMANMEYTVRIPNVTGGSKQSALGNLRLTTNGTGGAGQPDVRDSDGTLVGLNADATVLTTDIPISGANNHSFDFGFMACPDTSYLICNNGIDSVKLTADAGVTNVMWYDSTSNTLVGTGSMLVVKSTTTGMSDGYEAYYYTATMPDGCQGLLCCPVRVKTQTCITCSASVSQVTTQCNNNNTPANSSDDWFSVTLTGTISMGSGNYVVKVGAYTSPVTPSGTAITITGNGLAGNPLFQANGTSTYTLRIEDANDSSCFTTTTVGPINACSSCPSPNCKTVTVTKS